MCSAVKFVIDGPPSVMGTCHCSRCRKLGTSTIAFVTRDQFTLLEGADQIVTVEPTPQFTYRRSFCRHCGTSLGEPLSPDDSFPLNVQCFDDDPGIRNSFHEWVADRPAWAADLAPPDTPGDETHQT